MDKLKIDNTNTGKYVGQWELSLCLMGKEFSTTILENRLALSTNTEDIHVLWLINSTKIYMQKC